jgi:hypothetical protein
MAGGIVEHCNWQHLDKVSFVQWEEQSKHYSTQEVMHSTGGVIALVLERDGILFHMNLQVFLPTSDRTS